MASDPAPRPRAVASMAPLVRRDEDEASSLLPLFIVLAIFVALAIAWFALSSCMGDNLRRSISQHISRLWDRIRGRSTGRRRGRYGHMLGDDDDDPEATAFDVTFDDPEEDLYRHHSTNSPSHPVGYDNDDDDDASRRYEARQSQQPYGY
ncbi:uncharacterized protein PFL1_05120 [Pseudozyma flocculosa PF-1]|uniref:Uncharacterized protein n=2 Tax=Pseudozyma flocculosa TaxID=84751 RepID=A0A5C3F892_9BASI|nr:uncharacterized protein PFL1_05120 [Pseudozyma flocculosa PF-1]EPQ27197.1 hypothetical protein PFL1_05120 [Pseudozyma flocculosa PF-1]SPO39561.1 uncharacterized protein PSFLO_05042 [Pseudozyma flocculosa]